MSAKTGVLLFNLGGPSDLAGVKPFLYRLFSDPAIIVGLPAPLRLLIAFAIAQIKGPGSIETYRRIGGGSPQLCWTQAQAAGLERLLREAGIDARVAIGMRHSEPSIEAALRTLREAGVERLLVLPLFPQFSTTTTGSCDTELRRALRVLGWRPPLVEIRSWPEQPGYIALLRRTLEEALARAGSQPGTHVLFSAHSLPMRIVERGDPYPQETARTVAAAAAGLTLPWSLAWQSRNGRMPWLQPYTEEEIPRLAATGVKTLVVVPVSFVSDHIETLYELDMLYADLAREHGIEGYVRARAFNDDPAFQQVLCELARARLAA